jgi:hypothetical protein
MTLPVALFVEGSQVAPTLKALIAAGNGKTLLVQTLLSAVFYYLYNEVAFLALDNVAPVTHALGWKYLNMHTFTLPCTFCAHHDHTHIYYIFFCIIN